MEQKGLDFGTSAPKPKPEPRRQVFTVAGLTDRIQWLLETEMNGVWVEGEVSNLTIASSGHWYFSLKDERAQVRAVVWKTQARLIRFRPKDGMKVVVRGNVRVYPPKGEYQLSVETLEPLGKGALQQAFEELKERLSKEGLFEARRKRPLPMLPRRIGIVTSPTGAVIRDILRVLSHRYPTLEVLIYPARVQGEEAAFEIVQGIKALNRLAGLDVLIVARGGGSLEDLWPFNEERVARALVASKVPTISAVGHETDFTIADFVADLRAPTPSAAAERVVQAKDELSARVRAFETRMASALDLRLTRIRGRVASLTSHRVFAAERGRIVNQAQRVDDLVRRARLGLGRQAERAGHLLSRTGARLSAFRWDRQVAAHRERADRGRERLTAFTRRALAARRGAFLRLAGKLESLSPLAVLSRGYALVFQQDGRLVREPADVEVGEALRLRVHGGRLVATVTSKDE